MTFKMIKCLIGKRVLSGLLALLLIFLLLSVMTAPARAAEIAAADPAAITTIPSHIPDALAAAYPSAPSRVTVTGSCTVKLLTGDGYVALGSEAFGKYPQLWKLTLPAGHGSDVTLRLTKQADGLPLLSWSKRTARYAMFRPRCMKTAASGTPLSTA